MEVKQMINKRNLNKFLLQYMGELVESDLLPADCKDRTFKILQLYIMYTCNRYQQNLNSDEAVKKIKSSLPYLIEYKNELF